MDKARFIAQVAERVQCDQRRAEALSFAVFQELRERLTHKEALDVAAQLPAELKQMWLENERDGRSVARTHAAEFISRVRKYAALTDDAEAKRAVEAVFATLQNALGSLTGTEGEAWDILSQLPKDLKMLWLAARRGATG